MSEDSRGRHDDGKLLYCSFCGKSQHEVRKLIAGPSVFVCDECVELCNDIIREELEDRAERARDKLPKPHEIKKDTDRDNFMSAADAVGYGLIDKILESRGEMPVTVPPKT